jgi:phage gp29-like protein
MERGYKMSIFSKISNSIKSSWWKISHFRKVNQIKKEVEKEVDSIIEETLQEYSSDYSKYKGHPDFPRNVYDVKDKLKKKYKSISLDENKVKQIKQNVDKTYQDAIQQETYLYNNNIVSNPNININTGDTGYVINDVSFFRTMKNKDTHIRAAVSSIVDAITSRKWEITPALQSKSALKVATFVEHVLRDMTKNFSEILRNMVEAIVEGISIQECIWRRADGKIYLHDAEYRSPEDFEIDSKGNLFFRSNMGKSIPLPRAKFLIYAHKGNTYNPYGESVLGESIFWMYYFKKVIWKFRLRFLERFGNPIMIHKFQTEEERVRVFHALTYLASKGALQVPDGSSLEAVEVSRDTADFKSAIEDLNKEIEIAIVGQTATMTRENGGSYASDYIRQDQYYNKIGSLLNDIESEINNQIIKPLVQLNFPREKYFPKITFDKNDDVLKIKETERNLSVIRQGIPLKLIDIYRSLGLTMPDDMDVNSTSAAYYDTHGNITGGLPPEVRHQVRKDLYDPRIEDINPSTPPQEKYDGKVEGKEDPDFKKQQAEEDFQTRQKTLKRPGQPADNKGKVGKERNNPKSVK